MSDHRRCYRLDIALPVTLKPTSSKKKVLTAVTRDISALGFCILCKDRPSVGESVALELALPNRQKLKIHAQVVWVAEEPYIHDDKEYRAGVKIIDAPKADEKKFVKFYASSLLSFFKKK